MEILSMKCPNCGSHISGENVNIQELVGKCVQCGICFRLDGNESALPSCPESIRVESASDAEIVLTRRWFRWITIPMSFFCVFWTCILISWYQLAITSLQQGHAEAWMLMLFALPHLLVGMSLIYWTFALLVNTTRISASSSRIRIQHGPVPWVSVNIPSTSSIRHFAITADPFETLGFWRGKPGRFVLAVKMANRRKRTLLRHLTEDEAIYLASEMSIALHLGYRKEYTAADAYGGIWEALFPPTKSYAQLQARKKSHLPNP